MDSKTLSVLLGHYSVSFTLDTYAHVLDSQKIDSMGLMADLLNLPDTEIQPNAYSIIVSPKSDGSFYFSAPDFPFSIYSVNMVDIYNQYTYILTIVLWNILIFKEN